VTFLTDEQTLAMKPLLKTLGDALEEETLAARLVMARVESLAEGRLKMTKARTATLRAQGAIAHAIAEASKS